MYYVTGVSKDSSLFEITCCLTRKTELISRKQFETREDIFYGGRYNYYFSCTEMPTEEEQHDYKRAYPHSIEHYEDNRCFLFIPVGSVREIHLPVYVITRYKGDGTGPWKLHMLKKTDKGVTRIPEQAYQTTDKGEAIRKANSINDYYAKNRWTPANYKVMRLTEAIAEMKLDERRY